MKWQQRSGSGTDGPLLKWTTPGQTLEGRYLGMKLGKEFSGKRSKLITVEQSDGKKVTAGAPTVLAGELEGLASGVMVRIVFKGEQKGQNGVTFKAFDIFTAEPDGGAGAAGASAPQAQATDPNSLPALQQKLADKVGAEASKGMIAGLVQKTGGDLDKLRDGLKELLAAHGITA